VQQKTRKRDRWGDKKLSQHKSWGHTSQWMEKRRQMLGIFCIVAHTHSHTHTERGKERRKPFLWASFRWPFVSIVCSLGFRRASLVIGNCNCNWLQRTCGHILRVSVCVSQCVCVCARCPLQTINDCQHMREPPVHASLEWRANYCPGRYDIKFNEMFRKC